jgi:phosphatidylglycerophosphatase A
LKKFRHPLGLNRRHDSGSVIGDEQAAFAVAAWLQRADQGGSLKGFLNLQLTPEERGVAAVQGWILGVA